MRVFTPSPRICAPIPFLAGGPRTYPQISVSGTLRHGTEVGVTQVFGAEILAKPQNWTWSALGYLQGKLTKSTVPACHVISCIRRTQPTQDMTHNSHWFLRKCNLPVKMTILERRNHYTSRSARFVSQGHQIGPGFLLSLTRVYKLNLETLVSRHRAKPWNG